MTNAVVRMLEFCRTNAQRSGLDNFTLQNLMAWGPGDKQFLPLHPLDVDRATVLLLPPLSSAAKLGAE